MSTNKIGKSPPILNLQSSVIASETIMLVTGKLMVDMLALLAPKHYYGRRVMTLIPELACFIAENYQLQQTLANLAEKTDFVTTHQLHWSQLNKNEKKVINSFFDYLYFTSPQFLKDAG
ncbi:hypothetical protein [Legionella cardiaca]|uniref:Uncharacterized protein n=1 Tax=Legionella cardiaca TaxID=1071983 RepID=A0ABY8ANB6_9GAMM|nr:hypothetical protein [Legionella cardiaca]WED42183.1 hypothetical protein PXX05_09600 [Legionella cardiaca]